MFVFLARLIAFMIVISVIRSVVEYIKRLWNTPGQARPAFRASYPAQGVRDNPASPPTSTVLHQDPICGTYVAIDTSLKKIVAGKVYHFCSAECRNKFNT